MKRGSLAQVDRINLLLAYHYGQQGKTGAQIAELLNISQQTASRLILLAKAIVEAAR